MRIHISLLFIFTLLVGCGDYDESPIALPPEILPVNHIELILPADSWTGFSNETLNWTLQAIAYDADHSPLNGVKLVIGVMGVEDWKGSLYQSVSTTDENGMVTASYRVDLLQSGAITFIAYHEDLMVEKVLDLKVLNVLATTLNLESSRAVITLRPNQEQTAEIRATLSDSMTGPVSGVRIQLAVDQTGFGHLDFDTGTTDDNGQVIRNFLIRASAEPKFGRGNISAKCGHLESRVPIDIRPVLPPFRIFITPRDTTVYVEEGEDCIIQLGFVVTDDGGVGVPGTEIKFSISPFEPTDDWDEETRPYIDDQDRLHTNGYIGVFRVIAKMYITGEEEEILESWMTVRVILK